MVQLEELDEEPPEPLTFRRWPTSMCAALPMLFHRCRSEVRTPYREAIEDSVSPLRTVCVRAVLDELPDELPPDEDTLSFCPTMIVEPDREFQDRSWLTVTP